MLWNYINSLIEGLLSQQLLMTSSPPKWTNGTFLKTSLNSYKTLFTTVYVNSNVGSNYPFWIPHFKVISDNSSDFPHDQVCPGVSISGILIFYLKIYYFIFFTSRHLLN